MVILPLWKPQKLPCPPIPARLPLFPLISSKCTIYFLNTLLNVYYFKINVCWFAFKDSRACHLVTEQTRGGGATNHILLPNGTTLVLQGFPHPVLGSPCLPPGRDVSWCQRSVKRKGIIYLKSYANLTVMTSCLHWDPKVFRIPTNAQSFLSPLPSPGYCISEKEIEVRGSSLPKLSDPKKTPNGCRPWV